MKMRTQINHGDIVRTIRFLAIKTTDVDTLGSIAKLLGFRWTDRPIIRPVAENVIKKTEAVLPTKRTMPTQGKKEQLETANLAWIESIIHSASDALPDWYGKTLPLPKEQIEEDQPLPDPAPLLDPAWQRSILLEALLAQIESQEIDIDKIVECLSSRRPISRLPRRKVRSLEKGCQIIIDIEESMRPFIQDQWQIVDAVSRLVTPERIDIVSVEGPPLVGNGGYKLPTPGRPVLVLSNMGLRVGVFSPRQSHQSWLVFANRLKSQGCPLFVFLPNDVDRLPKLLLETAIIIPWDRITRSLMLRQQRPHIS